MTGTSGATTGIDDTGSSTGDSDSETTDPSTTTDTTDTTDGTDSDTDTGPEPLACTVPASFDPTDTQEWLDGPHVASVSLDDRDACLRTYTLSTTGPLRDNHPANPRVIGETEQRPRLRSGHDLFDALYALAQDEVGQASVQMITDYAFNFGGAVPCGAEGCFETGRLWHYVWTRDTAYATALGLAAVDPLRARNSLAFKLSQRRSGGDVQVVQDTGSGGSYPVSSDRVTWALGARAVLAALDGEVRSEFADQVYDALRNTTAHDRSVVFDGDDGLYRGEMSFLDWREQSYPDWTASDVVHIAQSKSLSTNLAHLAALELVAELATQRGDTQIADERTQWATDLRAAIQARMWLADEGQFSSHITTTLDPAPTRRFELLGSALAILLDVATPDQAAQILSGYPHYGPGAPVIWPQQQFTPIYHNRGEWPFVTAYALRAAAHADHDAVAGKLMRALIRGAALNLSNMENFEAGSGSNWVDEAEYSGPVVNSQRQLWSVAAYVSMVHEVLFGLHVELDGLRVDPYIPAEIRAQIFGGTNQLVLNAYPYRGRELTVILNLPDSAGTGSLEVTQLRVDGQVLANALIDAASLQDGAVIEVDLGPGSGPATSLTTRDGGDWRQVFGPRTPSITGLTDDNGRVRVAFNLAGEAPADISVRVLKDGAVVADNLPGDTTAWTDPNSDTAGPASPCYTLETSYASGNHSQHASPWCWWGPNNAHISAFAADQLVNVGGNGVVNHGRFHYEGWGAPDHTLTLPSFVPARTGRHLLQVDYGNGAGPINTGITCAVKRLRVERVSDDALLGEGLLIMPHLGTWDRWEDSNFVAVELQAGVEVRVVISADEQTVNMSAFDHFQIYTGGLGGVDGEYNYVNIATVRVLAKP
jgi:hypothetical protein